MRHLLLKFFVVIVPFTAVSQSISIEWVNNYETATNASVTTLEVNDGFVYATGIYTDSTDFDPSAGSDIYTTTSSSNAFVQKLDLSGNVIWTAVLGSQTSTGTIHIAEFVIDNNGDLLLVGRFNETVDFDPGVNTEFRTSGGGYDLFLLKISANGDLLWVKTTGSIAIHDAANAITFDTSGNILITGTFLGTCDFDFGSGVNTITSPNQNTGTFILKVNTAGDFIWVKQLESHYSVHPNEIDVDNSNNVYVTGRFQDSTDFDPGTGMSYSYPDQVTSGFVLKLNSNGDFEWVNTYADDITALHVDEFNQVFVGGYFHGTENFGSTPIDEISTQNFAGFVQKLDNNGSNQWTKAIHSESCLSITDIGTLTSGEVALAGNFFATTDFNTSNAVVESRSPISAQFPNDGYILKLNGNGEFVWVHTLGFYEGGGIEAFAIDTSDDIYVGGNFYGSAEFGYPYSTIFSAGIGQGYILKTGELVGINELYHEVVDIAPNPFDSSISVSFEFTESREISIYAMTGELVYKTKCNGIHKNLSLGFLPSGIYTISIRNKTSVVSDRLVKL